MVKNNIVHVTGWFLGLWCLGCLGCGGSVPLENWQKLGGRVSLDQQGEVESLYLGQTRVTDTDLRKLATLPRLKQLFLNGTSVTDEGLQHLRVLGELVYLDLESCDGISDAGMPHLLEIKTLQAVNLLDTRVTTVAIDRFAGELPGCRVASLLAHSQPGNRDVAGDDEHDLASRQVIEGLLARQLEKPFAEISQGELDQLRTLYLLDDNISSLVLAPELVGLEVLTVKSRNLRGLQGLERLSQLTKLSVAAGNHLVDLTPLSVLALLTELQLSDGRITDLGPLRELTRLQVLHVSEGEVEDLEPLKELKSLRELWLPQNQVKDLNPLRDLSGLEVLYLTDNPIEVLAALHELDSLKLLDVRRTQVSASEIEKFKAALPDCKVRH
ncbi:MAG: leucine-rich repeat domain-containing protein [Pirellulaceae bacterium]